MPGCPRIGMAPAAAMGAAVLQHVRAPAQPVLDLSSRSGRGSGCQLVGAPERRHPVNVPPSRPGRYPVPSAVPMAPHAALLIDFDNVTLGVRSDLTKELRTLLNSDIIKGKVAVQRAYADWRRYPQYIVPLSESSIDLIFAPAFGTNKKNATDIRLAVDAIELVFTRPEIGTIILLSGDSDFSSLVLKLKEYGKYVIGVGIRESASDLLIQNCDEYYSYSDLAGLTREADTPSVQRDPWELVVEAVDQMARNRDVMRSDRLKQVMQQIDPNFDERNAGFSRFSRFVTEAATKGLIAVTRLENGQYEVARTGAPAAVASATAAPVSAPEEAGEGASGRRRPSRGRRGRGRAGDEERRPADGERAAAAPTARPTSAQRTPGGLSLASAFHLLTRALGELDLPAPEAALRTRMRDLHGSEDPLLQEDRFTRLLRQANDAEVADVRRTPDDSFEVNPHRTDVALSRGARGTETAVTRPPVDATETSGTASAGAPTPSPSPAASPASQGRAALRFRRGSRGPRSAADVPLVGMVSSSPAPSTETREASAPAVTPGQETAAPRTKAKRKRGGRKSTGPKKGTAAATASVEGERATEVTPARATGPARKKGSSRKAAASPKAAPSPKKEASNPAKEAAPTSPRGARGRGRSTAARKKAADSGNG